MPDRQPCRCLLADSIPDLAVSVQQAISLLPEDKRTPEPEYRRRLSLCLDCPWLRDGTCAQCGCYVEARAAHRGQRCPLLPPSWEPV